MFETNYIEPHIMILEEDNIPILAFGESQFLSWFRGYRVQVSMSPEGRGDNGSSATTLASDLRTIRGFSYDETIESFKDVEKKYSKFVLLSHILEASNQYGKFISWMRTNSVLFDKFVEQTADFDSLLGFEEFNLVPLTDSIKEVKELDTADELKSILTSFGDISNEKTVSAVISIGKDYIAVKSFDEEVWHVLDISDLFPKEDNLTDGVDGYYGFVWNCLLQRLVYVVGYKANLRITQHYSRSYNFDANVKTSDDFDDTCILNNENNPIHQIIYELYQEKHRELIVRSMIESSEYNSANISKNLLG